MSASNRIAPFEPVVGLGPHNAARLRLALRHLVLIFLAESMALEVLALPLKLSFESYLLRDQASTLNWYYLLSRGYQINIDFGYQYGLLSLLLGKIWFAFFPATNLSILPLFITLNALAAIGIARFASYAKVGSVGLVLLIMALPIALQPQNTYYLESVFLTHGLAEHARGKRAAALALATASCFGKPAMGYFYGLVLIILIGLELRRRGDLNGRSLAAQIAPAAATALGLAVLLSLSFGVYTLASTILPLRGAETYRLLHFGLFAGSSRFLWYFPGVRIGYYFGTPTAFWIAGSLTLMACGVLALAYELTPSRAPRALLTYEIVLTCAALHVMFVTIFYGSFSSWTYYAFILIMGLAVASGWSSAWATVTIGLIILASIGNFTFLRSSYRGWRFTAPSSETAGLWAATDERNEWLHVESLVAGGKTTLLVPLCGGELIARFLEKPVSAVLVPGISVDEEVHRKAAQIAHVDFVVRPTSLALGSSPNDVVSWFPRLERSLADFRLVWSGKYFQVYGRVGPRS